MASSLKSLKIMVLAAIMRRLFGSRGGAGRRDVLDTEDANGPSISDRDQEARATKEKAKEQGGGPEKEGRFPPLEKLAGIKWKLTGRL